MKRPLHYLLPIFLFLFTQLSYSQFQGPTAPKPEELPDVIPPSPTVANLMRFEEVPVNHYSGIPDISVPLHSQKLNNNVDISVGLNYNPSGIRIDERSGWTGTGWTLNAESVISRTVMDVPDEIYSVSAPGGQAEGDIGTFSNDFYQLCNLDFSTASQQEIDDWNAFVWKTANGIEHFDYQPDLFQFSFYGYSGRFIILKIGGTLQPKIISSDQNVKITLNYTTNPVYQNENAYNLLSFEITDPYGNKFLFDNQEETQSTSVKNGRSQSNTLIGDSANSPPKIMNYISSWKLTSVSTPNNQILATYEYHNVTEMFRTPSSLENGKIITAGALPAALTGPLASANASLMPPKWISTASDLIIASKKIKKITFRDSTSINFSISPFHPEFISCMLTKIEVKDENDMLEKRWDFSYQVNSNNRLFLDFVSDVSAQNTTLKYDFTYENQNELPAFGSEFKDGWGYYKGTNDTYNVIDYEAKAKSGVLKSITYPTGGKKEFDFELNQIAYIGQSLVNVNDLPDNRAPQYPPPNRIFSGDVSEINQETPLPQRLFFYVDIAQNADIKYQVTSTIISNQIIYPNHKVYLNKVTLNPGVTSPKFDSQVSTSTPITEYDLASNNNLIIENQPLSTGWYLIKVDTATPYFMADPGLPGQPNHTVLDVEVTVNLTTFVYNTRNLRGGGLRIKSIRFTENGNDQTKVDFNYNLLSSDSSLENPDPIDPNKPLSSGAFEGSILMNRTYTKSMDLITPIECPGGWGTINNHATTNYQFKVTKQLNEILGHMTKGNYVGYKNVTVTRTGNGRTEYEFTNALDYPTYPNSYYTFGFPYFEAPVEDIDHKKGLMIKETVFSESDDKVKETINSYYFPEIAEYNYLYSYYASNCPYDMFYSSYNSFLSNTADTEQACLITTAPGMTPNCFPPPNYIGLKEVKHVWGKSYLDETITKDYFYDDLDNQTFKEIKQTFVYNSSNFQIKEQSTYYDKSGTPEHLKNKYYYPLGGVPSNYNNSAMISRLVALNKINEVLSTESYRNGTLLSQVQTQYFEPMANLVLPQKVKTLKGTNTSEDRVQFHRYDIYGNPLEVSKTNGTPISYIWGYKRSYPVAKLEGVTFAQIETQFGTNFHSGDAALTLQQITDLKSYFPNAMISTYTYEPLVGVTSITDARGYTMYYEYDEFNRLIHVRDHLGNVESFNSYHYKNEY